jgi:hypothetical protein
MFKPIVFFLCLAFVPALGLATEGRAARSGTQAKAGKASSTDARDAYVRVVENKLEVWDKMIHKIRSRTYTDKDFKRETSPEEAIKAADELEAKRKLVAADLDQLRKAQDSEWKMWQSKIQANLNSMGDRFSDTLGE